MWRHAGVPWSIALFQSGLEYGTLASLSAVVWRLSARLTARRLPLPRLVLAHGLLAASVIAVWKGLLVLVQYLNLGSSFWRLVYAPSWIFQAQSALITYAAMLGVILALQARGRERARERREAELQVAAREAELGALKAHLQPHFLFNALHSLLALIDKDPAAAKELLARLASLLQAVVARLDSEAIPLADELELLRTYLEVERVRFGPRLSVVFDVDGASDRLLVPPLILQPIVENAVKHGVAPHARPGTVSVRVRRAGDELRLRVTDTGDGTDGRRVGAAGRGLELTRRRLTAAYPDAHQLLFSREPEGFSVELRLPAREHAG